MKATARPLLAGMLLMTLGGAAVAQTPATRPCLEGEERIGGVCQPLTRVPTRPGETVRDTGSPAAPDRTGSTGVRAPAGTTGTGTGVPAGGVRSGGGG
ncbi:hypothetical protein [Microvirga lenta]|uniref:hypothetical protein n=1 Tax=Microvirga lenta TaxID=2881337 RepID=UPI001CFF5BB2|nr:hypothetical protein [Microvirga lenta]MCB5174794.1 hypothetical protein [Microvirga lenta]